MVGENSHTGYEADNEDYDHVIPNASAMFESMRAYGYSTEAAIADIIDNSISAGARNINIEFHWAGKNSWIYILDDGNGMDEEELIVAMKPGSRNPLEEREPKDLGRFGLGLKTASLSQCRILTVATKKTGGSIFIRRWDLDHIQEVQDWQLLKTPSGPGKEIAQHLAQTNHGTIVIWQDLDRIVGNSQASDRKAHNRFLELIDRAENHLAMVFHRFLESGKDGISIYINGKQEDRKILPWDPFMEDRSHIEPEERISYGDQHISVRGYILPHKDKLDEDTFKMGSGVKGWNSQQGFYIYRNKRLIVAGSWLDLGIDGSWKKEEQYRLARIKVDIPNSLDQDWQVDVKKSTAKPPGEVRQRLTEIGKIVRDRALAVFIHRGEYGPRERRQNITRIWMCTGGEKRRYKIDAKHPLVKEIIELDPPRGQRVKTLLRALEETVPVEQIWLDMADGAVAPKRFEEETPDEVKEYISQTFIAIVRQEGKDPEAARKRLANMDIFADYRNYIEGMVLPKVV